MGGAPAPKSKNETNAQYKAKWQSIGKNLKQKKGILHI